MEIETSLYVAGIWRENFGTKNKKKGVRRQKRNMFWKYWRDRLGGFVRQKRKIEEMS